MNKKSLLSLILTFSLASSVCAREGISSVFDNSYAEENIEMCLKEGLSKLGIDINKEIPSENLSAIHQILKYTYENNIHKMRFETDNSTYTKKTGQEAVFDKDGNLVTNDWNRGSFNLGTYDDPITKFEVDIWPWLVWGNTANDPTVMEERFFHYIMDLDNGIQGYLFFKDKENLETVSFAELDEMDRAVYHLFNYILFNEDYEYKLSKDKIPFYTTSAENYWMYLEQICDLITNNEDSSSIIEKLSSEKDFNLDRLELLGIKEYDRKGRLFKETMYDLKWNDVFIVYYFYDLKDNLSFSRHSSGVTTTYTKIDDNTVSEEWSNDIKKTYVYKDGNQVKEIFYQPDLEEPDYIEYFFDENGLETYYRANDGRTSWNEYNDSNLLVYRHSDEGNEYYFGYQFWSDGTVKKRMCYKLNKQAGILQLQFKINS